LKEYTNSEAPAEVFSCCWKIHKGEGRFLFAFSRGGLQLERVLGLKKDEADSIVAVDGKRMKFCRENETS